MNKSQEPIKYNIATLVDMGHIPEDRVPAFMAEFPKILAHMRAFVKAEGLVDPKMARVIQESAVWVDDGIVEETKTTLRITQAPLDTIYVVLDARHVANPAAGENLFSTGDLQMAREFAAKHPGSVIAQIDSDGHIEGYVKTL